MARMSLHEYEALSREERLRRIGALFYKAVVISLARKQTEAEAASGDGSAHAREVTPAGASTVTSEMTSLPEDDLALLRRYALLGEIAPREATEFWGVSRTTAYRRLVELEKAGWIERRGATKATRYVFTVQARGLLERVERIKQPRDGSRADT